MRISLLIAEVRERVFLYQCMSVAVHMQRFPHHDFMSPTAELVAYPLLTVSYLV